MEEQKRGSLCTHWTGARRYCSSVSCLFDDDVMENIWSMWYYNETTLSYAVASLDTLGAYRRYVQSMCTLCLSVRVRSDCHVVSPILYPPLSIKTLLLRFPPLHSRKPIQFYELLLKAERLSSLTCLQMHFNTIRRAALECLYKELVGYFSSLADPQVQGMSVHLLFPKGVNICRYAYGWGCVSSTYGRSDSELYGMLYSLRERFSIRCYCVYKGSEISAQEVHTWMSRHLKI